WRTILTYGKTASSSETLARGEGVPDAGAATTPCPELSRIRTASGRRDDHLAGRVLRSLTERARLDMPQPIGCRVWPRADNFPRDFIRTALARNHSGDSHESTASRSGVRRR